MLGDRWMLLAQRLRLLEQHGIVERGRRTRRQVARFDFTAPRRESRWLLIERGEATACDEDPGRAPFAGRLAMRAALRDGALRLDGEPEMVRGFPRWFGFGPFAEETRAVLRRGA